jgi:hypothetical protein
MANTVNGLLTYEGATAIIGTLYLSNAPTQSTNALSRIYTVLGKVDSWPDDNAPPMPGETAYDFKVVSKNFFAGKKITASSISPVIPRFDWTSGFIYSQYTDYDTIITYDADGIMNNPFYVRNRYDQIFKCLWNNNGSPSTVEPVVQPGSTNVTQAMIMEDGYKWIYLTTIDKGLKKTFFDNNWMPITYDRTPPNTLGGAKFGSIDAINITNAGNDYITGISTTTITVNGDGVGAAAYANVMHGEIQDIIVTSAGNNYTFATVTIQSTTANGSGATANAVVSPIGGHGYDIVSELGCNHVMITSEFNGSESSSVNSTYLSQIPLPTDVSFRQVGLILNPLLSNGQEATDLVYNMSDILTTSSGVGEFVSGERVEQTDFSAILVSHDTTNNIISLINTEGTYTLGAPIVGANSGVSRVILTYTPTVVNLASGYLMYYENRIPVERSPSGNEQTRIVLQF